MLNKKFTLSILFCLLLVPFVYGKSIRQIPLRSVILNEYSPDNAIFNPPNLYVGSFETEKEKYRVRTLLYFDINEIADIRNKHISNALLEVGIAQEPSFTSKDEYRVSIHKVLVNWDKATWNNQPYFDNNFAASAIIAGDGKYTIRLNDLVKEWASNPNSNFGMLIKGIDEESLNIKKIENAVLYVEYEDANDCNRNNGVCRKECGNEQIEAEFSCGFLSGEACCIGDVVRERGVTTTTSTTTTTTIPLRDTKGSKERVPLDAVANALKCPDGTLEGFCSAKSSTNANKYACLNRKLVEDSTCNLIFRRIKGVDVKAAGRDEIKINTNDGTIECKDCTIYTDDRYETGYFQLTSSKLQVSDNGKTKNANGIGIGTLESKTQSTTHNIVLHKPGFSPIIPPGTTPDELFEAMEKTSSIPEMAEYLQGKKGKGNLRIEHNPDKDKIIGDDAVVITKDENVECEEEEKEEEEEEEHEKEKKKVNIIVVFDKKDADGSGMEKAREHHEEHASPSEQIEHGEQGGELNIAQKSIASTLGSLIPGLLGRFGALPEAVIEREVGTDVGKNRLYFGVEAGIGPKFKELIQDVIGGVRIYNNLKNYVEVLGDLSVRYERCPFSIGLKSRVIEYASGESFLESLEAEADIELREGVVVSVMKKGFRDYAFIYTLTVREMGIGLRVTPEGRNLKVSGAIISYYFGEFWGMQIGTSFIWGEAYVDDGHHRS